MRCAGSDREAGNCDVVRCDQHGMDDEERQALRAEGARNPDDLVVVAAIDMVRWELSLYGSWAASRLPLIH